MHVCLHRNTCTFAHPCQPGGQTCKRSHWHCDTSLAALCKCRLQTGFWINGSEMIYLGYLPPEHRHMHTHTYTNTPHCIHTHNTSFFPPSLLFIQRRWRRDTPTPRGKREKSGRAASYCVVLSHIIWQIQRFTSVSFIIQFGLSFSDLSWFIPILFFSRQNGKYDWGHAKNGHFPDLGFSGNVCNIISRNIRYYTLTTRDISTGAAAATHRTTGLGRVIRITVAVVTYEPLAIIKSASLCFWDENAAYVCW